MPSLEIDPFPLFKTKTFVLERAIWQIMSPHQPRPNSGIPKIWLFTDVRNDARLEQSLNALPRGSGVVFRHYHLEFDERVKRFAAVKRQARRNAHILLIADSPKLARAWGADGVHGRHWEKPETIGLLHSAPVHNAQEIALAKKNGADLFFLSPIFATRSHPDKTPLNALQAKQLINLCVNPVILLGGMTEARFRDCAHLNAYGWGAIDSLSKT